MENKINYVVFNFDIRHAGNYINKWDLKGFTNIYTA